MLHHSQSLNIISPSKKIKKPAKKPSSPLPHLRQQISTRSFPSNGISLDPIKSPFFSNFLYYPSSVKASIMRINRKPISNDLDNLVKDLPFSNDFINIESLRVLVQEQENIISSIINRKLPTEVKMIQKPVPQQVMQRKFDLKVDTKPITSLNDSDEFVKDFFAKKENSFYESSISTTPSKKNSPLFNERKNLLLSSQIENILSDNYELFVKKFDEESLNLGSLEEEDQGMYREGLWEEKEKFREEGGIFKGLDVDRSFFSHDRDNLNYF
jgi:hypothetical protein